MVLAMYAKALLSQTHQEENVSLLFAQKLALLPLKEHANHVKEVRTQIKLRLNASMFNVDQDKESLNPKE